MAAPSSHPGNGPHFSPEAARAVFRRAAEHQEMARAAQADADGFSLAELQSIGAEAGIDPTYIAAAAAEVQTDSTTEDVPWWYAGSPTVEVEAVVPGPVTDGPVWAALVRELRTTFGADGVATQLGNALEWSFEPPMGGESTRVDVTPEPHGTRIRITRSKLSTARMGAMLGGMFGVSGLVLGALILGIKGFDLAGLAFMLALWVVGAAIAGLNIPVHRAAVRREQEQFDRLMDRLELIVLKANTPPAQTTAAQAPEPNRLAQDVSALDAPPTETVNGTRERARS